MAKTKRLKLVHGMPGIKKLDNPPPPPKHPSKPTNVVKKG